MAKRIKVSAPKPDEVVKDLTEFMSIFEHVELDDHPLIKSLNECHDDPVKFFEAIKDPTLVTLWKIRQVAIDHGPKDDKRHKQLINLLGLLILGFKASPWMRSRIGWFMWMCSCYSAPDSYYQMRFEDHFEPARWYKHGEQIRPEHKQSSVKNPSVFVLD